MNIAMIIAGGSGNRMHQDIPKQFLTVNEKPVIIYTLEVFQRHPAVDEIAVVCIEGCGLYQIPFWNFADFQKPAWPLHMEYRQSQNHILLFC